MSNIRSRSNIDMMHPAKPKKTILVKVSSNDALPSKSELATKQHEDELL